MQFEFDMTDLGVLSYFLGIEFVHTEQGIMMHQKKYIAEVLKRFDMINCNPATTPIEANLKLIRNSEEKAVDSTFFKQIVGSLRYICNSRPDISFAVGLVSRFMDDPKHSHLVATKRILRYLKGTMDFGVLFSKNKGNGVAKLIGYSDLNWCGDQTDRRSTTGNLFKLFDAPISWCLKKQPVVALSSYEVEYIAASYAACQVMWLDSVLREIQVEVSRPILLNVDNKSAINLAKNPVAHGRSKHIDTRFHFLRDQVNNHKLEMVFCNTNDQVADVLTKPLKAEKFKLLRGMLGVVSLSILN